jgi:hypothetical protein
MTDLDKAILGYIQGLPAITKSGGGKDVSHLIQKRIVNKDGKAQTVWVDPNKGKPKDDDGKHASGSSQQEKGKQQGQHALHGMQVGEVRKYGGKSLMKIGPNRYAAVTKGKHGGHVTDKNDGFQFKRDIFGKIHAESFKIKPHEVTHAENQSKRKGSSAISGKELEKQKKDSPKNITELRPGHIVRIRFGEGVSKDEEKAGGKVGKIQEIKNNIAYILDQAGRLIDVPLRTLEFAKSNRRKGK